MTTCPSFLIHHHPQVYRPCPLFSAAVELSLSPWWAVPPTDLELLDSGYFLEVKSH